MQLGAVHTAAVYTEARILEGQDMPSGPAL